MKKKNIAIILFLLVFSMSCVLTDLINGESNNDAELGDMASTLSVLQTRQVKRSPLPMKKAGSFPHSQTPGGIPHSLPMMVPEG